MNREITPIGFFKGYFLLAESAISNTTPNKANIDTDYASRGGHFTSVVSKLRELGGSVKRRSFFQGEGMAFRLTGFLMHEGFTQDNYTKCLWCGKERGASRMCVLCGVSLCSEEGCFWKFIIMSNFPRRILWMIMMMQT